MEENVSINLALNETLAKLIRWTITKNMLAFYVDVNVDTFDY